jgi:acetyl-CoA carboxylase carboxyltransferase component
MFVDAAASMAVPMFTIVLRKGYGVGAQAMAAGGLPCAGVHGGLAQQRIRRHGAEESVAARLS